MIMVYRSLFETRLLLLLGAYTEIELLDGVPEPTLTLSVFILTSIFPDSTL